MPCQQAAVKHALYVIARISARGTTFASWTTTKQRVRWTADPEQATSFKARESAQDLIPKRAPRGVTFQLLRMILP